MSASSKSIAWWAKLLAVIGLLCLLDACGERSSEEATVTGKEKAELGFRGEGDSFQLNAEGPRGPFGFLVSADAYHGLQPGDRVRVHHSLILGRYRGVSKGSENYSDLNFSNILIFFCGIAVLLPFMRGLLLSSLRRLFGKWLPGL